MNKKTLIIVRHAHRTKRFGSDADNGISDKGWKQAKAILKYYKQNHGKRKPYIISSPKIRCLDTVVLIAEHTKTQINVSDLLLEQFESDRVFLKRVQDFKKWWEKEAPPLTIACSHGDWIPLALKTLTGAESDLAKGGWAEIDKEAGKTELLWLIQDFNR